MILVVLLICTNYVSSNIATNEQKICQNIIWIVCHIQGNMYVHFTCYFTLNILIRAWTKYLMVPYLNQLLYPTCIRPTDMNISVPNWAPILRNQDTVFSSSDQLRTLTTISEVRSFPFKTYTIIIVNAINFDELNSILSIWPFIPRVIITWYISLLQGNTFKVYQLVLW